MKSMKQLLSTLILIMCLASGTLAQRPKVALVLGGGGAKGAATIGALEIIDQYDIPIDYVVGTSIGSIVGGLYAAGYTPKELSQMFETQSWPSLIADYRKDLAPNFDFSGNPMDIINGLLDDCSRLVKKDDDIIYLLGVPVADSKLRTTGYSRGDNAVHLVDSMLAIKGCRTFEELERRTHRKFRCVAADLPKTEVVKTSGSIAEAIRSSFSFPLVFQQPEDNGHWLTDGGTLNNLPIDIAKELGADYVIVVDLNQDDPNDTALRRFVDHTLVGEWLVKKLLGNCFKLINTYSNNGVLYGSSEWLEWAIDKPGILKYEANMKLLTQNDVYINPTGLGTMGTFSFTPTSIKEMHDKGYDEAKKHRPELLKLERRIHNSLPRPAVRRRN